MTSPVDVENLLQDALDTQSIIRGPTISFDRADDFHHVIGVIQTESAYMANHNGTAFPIPKCLGQWDDKVPKDTTVVEMKKAKAIHKFSSEDYDNWKTAEDGCKKLICAAVEEVYINKLKEDTTFFHKVFACDLLEHLEKNSTLLYDFDIIALRSSMLLLYKNAPNMPDFIG
jgi:hypothetical protein